MTKRMTVILTGLALQTCFMHCLGPDYQVVLFIITMLKGNSYLALHPFLFLYVDMKFLKVKTSQNIHT